MWSQTPGNKGASWHGSPPAYVTARVAEIDKENDSTPVPSLANIVAFLKIIKQDFPLQAGKLPRKTSVGDRRNHP